MTTCAVERKPDAPKDFVVASDETTAPAEAAHGIRTTFIM